MWGSLVALVVFTVLCWRLVGPLGAPGLGWANTVAMATFGLFLTALYLRRFGADRKAAGTAAIAIGRQVLVAAVVGVALLRLRPWLGSIDHTSLDGALRMAAALGSTGLAYAAGVTLLGGREIRELLAAVRSGGDR
jgi:peptidoglycan biosynthesis protein MviN/MurJ (putative lipid II flippase)